MRIRSALLLLPLLIVACGGQASHRWSDKDYQGLRSSFALPSGFTPASPDGPCTTDPHMQCWTTTLLPAEAVKAAVAGLGASYRTTDSSWCGPTHWATQRQAWGESHTPCTLHGTSRGMQVIVDAIAFPDRKASTPGHLVFPPTVVSIAAFAP